MVLVSSPSSGQVSCRDAAAPAAAKSLQSCPTLCDPIDSSPPGSSIPGILQARTLDWVAISFSNACMQSCFSCAQLCATQWTAAYQAPLFTGFSRQEYRSGLPYPSPPVGIYPYNSIAQSRELQKMFNLHLLFRICEWKSFSHVWLCNPMYCSLPGFSVHELLIMKKMNEESQDITERLEIKFSILFLSWWYWVHY